MSSKKDRQAATEEAILQKGYALFDRFFQDTRQYRQKCRENEAYWRTNHWDAIGVKNQEDPHPVTPVLFSTLESMLADLMDYYPEAILLGEEASDDEVAERLTQVVQYILKRRGFRTTYRKKCRHALKKGTSVLEVFWDTRLLNGLGDINVKERDICNFVWDPQFENFQDGRAVFTYSFYPKEWFEARYSEKAQEMVGDGYRREHMDSHSPRDEDEYMLLEYWYKEYDPELGRNRVHMARLAGGVLLEDSRRLRPEGMYAHGEYPFILEPLFPLDGQPVGLGLIDVLKNLQIYADKMDQIIMKNALMSGQLKMMVNKNADIDEEALLDWSSEVVRAGRIGDDSVRFLQAAPMNPYVFTYQQSKLKAIKEESGQTMYTRGEGGGGVTAASAIMALQEAGSKRSRLIVEQMNDGFGRMVRMVVGIMAEFYSEERFFRIRGEQEHKFGFSADSIRLVNGETLEFDIHIEVQKQTPYRTLYQNELALQLLQAGMVDPEEALEMMTFEGKDRLLSAKQMKRLEAGIGQEAMAPPSMGGGVF